MKSKFLTSFLILILWTIDFSYSQNRNISTDTNQLRIAVLSKGFNDSIVIRWAPNKATSWTMLNKSGYVIERITIPQDGKVNPRAMERKVFTKKPWSLEEWKQKANRSDTMAAVAAQSLYGKSFNPTTISDEFSKMQALSQEQNNRFSFALLAADISVVAAEGLGLRFVDRQIDKNKKYVYKVYPATSASTIKIDTGYTFVTPLDTSTIPAPTGLKAIEGERAIRLQWDFYETSYYFSGYFIERSSDEGKSWKRLNAVPLVQPLHKNSKSKPSDISYTDSISVNYKPYLYRVRGVTPFAILSPPSKSIKAIGRDRTAPAEPHIDTIVINKNRITINWSKKIVEDDFAGFLVGRSSSAVGPYDPLQEVLLPKNMNTYTDSTFNPEETNYYVIAARDTAGNTSLSLAKYAFIIDTLPPIPPKGLTGTIDSLGVVKLKWNLGKESDIIGYRVFLANQLDHAFLQRTKDPVKDTMFTDTISLGTLTRHVYYRIAAVDRYFNTSKFSDSVTLTRRDTIAPGAPLITYLRSSDSSIYIEWAPSKVQDLAYTSLYRNELQKNDSVLLQKVPFYPYQKTWYEDTSAMKGKTYEYWLVSTDSSGLKSSPSPKVKGRVYDTGLRPGVKDFSVKVNTQDKKEIKITWVHPEIDSVRFVLYRKVNNYNLGVYKSFDSKQREFTDTDLPLKGKYSYALKVVYTTGGASLISKEKTTEIQ